MYDKYFPIVSKFITTKALLNPWITASLVNRIKIKDNLNKLSINGRIDRIVYTRFRNKVTSLIRQAKAKYFDQEFAKCRSNIRKTWKIINDTIRRKAKENYISLSVNDEIIEDSKIRENLLPTN